MDSKNISIVVIFVVIIILVLVYVFYYNTSQNYIDEYKQKNLKMNESTNSTVSTSTIPLVPSNKDIGDYTALGSIVYASNKLNFYLCTRVASSDNNGTLWKTFKRYDGGIKTSLTNQNPVGDLSPDIAVIPVLSDSESIESVLVKNSIFYQNDKINIITNVTANSKGDGYSVNDFQKKSQLTINSTSKNKIQISNITLLNNGIFIIPIIPDTNFNESYGTVGSILYSTDTERIYICTDVTDTATSWAEFIPS